MRIREEDGGRARRKREEGRCESGEAERQVKEATDSLSPMRRCEESASGDLLFTSEVSLVVLKVKFRAGMGESQSKEEETRVELDPLFSRRVREGLHYFSVA